MKQELQPKGIATMNDFIELPPPGTLPSIATSVLTANSALADITNLVEPELHLIRPYSWLSSGEQLLWRALGILASGRELTVAEMAEAGSTLDAPNLRALRDANSLLSAVTA